MKKKMFLAALVFTVCIIFCGCYMHTITEEYQLIRIHIRANSNGANDQAVKLRVRDDIAAYLERELKDIYDFETAYSMISARLTVVRQRAQSVLRANGFSYGVNAKLNNEFFPTRSYDGIVVESGYYDALIIELGEAQGDNWWCVIYPPLCYIDSSGGSGFRYKSRLSEVFKKYFG